MPRALASFHASSWSSRYSGPFLAAPAGVESAKRLLDRGHDIVAMDLVQVDMVGLQTAKTGLHTIHNVAARSADVIPPRPDAAIDLRPNHRVLPRAVKEKRLGVRLVELTTRSVASTPAGAR